jgi:branched-chain amino acid transport system ATP-binding protein
MSRRWFSPLLVREIFGSFRKSMPSTAHLSPGGAECSDRLGIAHYGYIMENGRIVLDGPAEMMRGNEDVREFYLGLSAAGRQKSFKDLKFYKRRKRWVF